MYLDICDRIADESHAVRLKVGAVFVSPDGVMSIGINGLPANRSNDCEEEIDGALVTRNEVSHAEANALGKMLYQGVAAKNGIMFINFAPCIQCAKLMVVAGIIEVVYRRDYKGTDGIEWLVKNNVKCYKENHANF